MKIVNNRQQSDKQVADALIEVGVAPTHCAGTKRAPPVVPMLTILPTRCVRGRRRPTMVQDAPAGGWHQLCSPGAV